VLIRNAATVAPTLNRGMVPVPELTGQWADAAELVDEFCVGHITHVRNLRTERNPFSYVSTNVESVPMPVHTLRMGNDTIGAKLRRLQERSGRSYEEIARAAGYAGKSSVQRYFEPTFDGDLRPDVWRKLAKGFEGSPVDPAEIIAVSGISALSNATPVVFNGPGRQKGPQDLPIYGSALGADLDFSGTAVEQTHLNTGDVVQYISRPSAVANRPDVYGVYIQGSSMAPRYQEGELAVVETRTPPRVGDDVVVYLCNGLDDGEEISACLIKRLVRRSGSYIELEQFQPHTTFRIESNTIKKVHRVIPWAELFN